jgi:hypothetical protein
LLNQQEIDSIKKLKVNFKVLGGFQIPCKIRKGKDIVDPFVEVVLHSTAHPLSSQVLLKTKIIDDNGFNPLWDEEVEFSIT